MTNRF